MYARLIFGGCMKTSVLLVDDKPRMLKVIASALPGDQYELRFALNREDALREIQRKEPSFLLLDASSLSEDPWDLTRYIREVLHQNQVKILFLASHFFHLDQEKLEKYNIAGVINKPFTPEELIKKLRSLGVEEVAKTRHKHIEPEVPPKEEVGEAEQEETVLEEASLKEDFVFNSLEDCEIDVEKPKVEVPGKKEIVAAEEIPPPAPDSLVEDLLLEQQKEKEEEENAYFINKEDALQDDAWKSWVQVEVAPEKKEDKRPLEADRKKVANDKDSYFNIGNSKFSFRKDYIDRLGKRVESYEEVLGSSNVKNASSENVFSSEQKEKIFREETRKFCEEMIEKVASSMVPEIAERVVKEKLEGILDSMKEENS